MSHFRECRLQEPPDFVTPHHFTLPAPGRQGTAPLTSLKDHGMSDPQQWGDRWWIHAQLPHTFTQGDNISMAYWGPDQDGATSEKQATEMACKDMLMMLLAIAPNDVQLAPGSFRHGSLPRIRNLAGELSHAVQQEEGWHHLTQLATDAMARRLPSAPGVTDHGSSKARPALVLVPRGADADREARCIVALHTLRRGEEHSPTALPRQVWAVLAENLVPGSLTPLLLRHPDLFWIADGAGHPWTFQVIGARHPPEEQPPEADGSGQPPTDG